MPIYEYQCRNCGNQFEELRLSSSGFKNIKCPKCKSGKVEKAMSTFSPSMGGFSSGVPCETGPCPSPSASPCSSGMCGL